MGAGEGRPFARSMRTPAAWPACPPATQLRRTARTSPCCGCSLPLCSALLPTCLTYNFFLSQCFLTLPQHAHTQLQLSLPTSTPGFPLNLGHNTTVLTFLPSLCSHFYNNLIVLKVRKGSREVRKHVYNIHLVNKTILISNFPLLNILAHTLMRDKFAA